MKYRNAIYTSDNGIDCEIEHPIHGWIPFHAMPSDPEEFGRLLFEHLKDIAAEFIPDETEN